MNLLHLHFITILHSSYIIFDLGGSISNIMGIHLARYKLNPKVKTDGNSIFRKPLVILTSEEVRIINFHKP